MSTKGVGEVFFKVFLNKFFGGSLVATTNKKQQFCLKIADIFIHFIIFLRERERESIRHFDIREKRLGKTGN